MPKKAVPEPTEADDRVALAARPEKILWLFVVTPVRCAYPHGKLMTDEI